MINIIVWVIFGNLFVAGGVYYILVAVDFFWGL